MNSLNKAIAHFGGQIELAKALSAFNEAPVSRQAVNKWVKKGFVPPIRAKQIELISGGKFSRSDLRPDIFG